MLSSNLRKKRYFSQFPKYCGHCHRYLNKSAYYDHKKHYFNETLQTWSSIYGDSVKSNTRHNNDILQAEINRNPIEIQNEIGAGKLQNLRNVPQFADFVFVTEDYTEILAHKAILTQYSSFVLQFCDSVTEMRLVSGLSCTELRLSKFDPDNEFRSNHINRMLDFVYGVKVELGPKDFMTHVKLAVALNMPEYLAALLKGLSPFFTTRNKQNPTQLNGNSQLIGRQTQRNTKVCDSNDQQHQKSRVQTHNWTTPDGIDSNNLITFSPKRTILNVSDLFEVTHDTKRKNPKISETISHEKYKIIEKYPNISFDMDIETYVEDVNVKDRVSTVEHSANGITTHSSDFESFDYGDNMANSDDMTNNLIDLTDTALAANSASKISGTTVPDIHMDNLDNIEPDIVEVEPNESPIEQFSKIHNAKVKTDSYDGHEDTTDKMIVDQLCDDSSDSNICDLDDKKLLDDDKDYDENLDLENDEYSHNDIESENDFDDAGGIEGVSHDSDIRRNAIGSEINEKQRISSEKSIQNQTNKEETQIITEEEKAVQTSKLKHLSMVKDKGTFEKIAKPNHQPLKADDVSKEDKLIHTSMKIDETGEMDKKKDETEENGTEKDESKEPEQKKDETNDSNREKEESEQEKEDIEEENVEELEEEVKRGIITKNEEGESHDDPEGLLVFKSHINRNRSSMTKRACTNCDETYDNVTDLKKHLETVHNMVSCTVCPKRIFAYNQDRVIHELSHKDSYPYIIYKDNWVLRYKCFKCPMEFTNSNKMIKHLTCTHDLPKKKYNCPKCNIPFMHLRSFDAHFVKHFNDLQENQCTICGKVLLGGTSALRIHVRSVHERRKDHMCFICGHKATQMGNLRRHMIMAHPKTMKKPLDFKCAICDKKFPLKEILTRHMNTHEKPYICSVCGERFIGSEGFKRHWYTHNDVKRFHCTICDKGYNDKRDVIRHAKSIHNVVLDRDKITLSDAQKQLERELTIKDKSNKKNAKLEPL